MCHKRANTDSYGDGDIPEVDLPKTANKDSYNPDDYPEPIPESERPRRDGPGGE